AKPAKKNQPAKTSKAKGLTILFEVALTEAEQMELATKRSLIQTHSSHASGSGADEGTGDKPGVPDVPTYGSDDEQVSWKSSDEKDDDDDADSQDDDDDADNQDDDDNDDDDQNDENTNNENDNNDDDDGQDHKGPDDDNEQTNSDNDGDDFVHPKFSTHDEEDNEEEELDEEETHEEDEGNELYRDVNINLDGRDTEITDALRTIIQTTQVIEDTHVIITPVNPEGQQQSSSVSSGFVSNMLNPSPDIGIDSIFNLNIESTSLVDVSVTTIAEIPLSSATTPPPPTIPLITHLQQTQFPHQ
ncbi:hypothetical protein Tco_0022520, partial [Tanacetum coccineum]